MTIITEITGDLFSAPTESILIHACNAKGVWGSSVALGFKLRFPQAFKAYTTHCKSPPEGISLGLYQEGLVGTCLLIDTSGSQPSQNTKNRARSIPGINQYYIACLFTSVGYGKNVSTPDVILRNTASALQDLETHISLLKREKDWQGQVWAVRINSGRFGVAWQRTKHVLKIENVNITVVRPQDDEEESQTQYNKTTEGRRYGKRENSNVEGINAESSKKRGSVDEAESHGISEEDSMRVEQKRIKWMRRKAPGNV